MRADDGLVVKLGTCKKESGILLSIKEVEFIAASHAGTELVGLRGLFGETNMRVVEPTPMSMENQRRLGNDGKREKHLKHETCRRSFKCICHRAQAKVVQASFIKSDDMMVALLPKALPEPRILGLRGIYKLKSIQHDVEEET